MFSKNIFDIHLFLLNLTRKSVPRVVVALVVFFSYVSSADCHTDFVSVTY